MDEFERNLDDQTGGEPIPAAQGGKPGETPEEVRFPKKSAPVFPDGDATSDILRPDSMNHNASAGANGFGGDPHHPRFDAQGGESPAADARSAQNASEPIPEAGAPAAESANSPTDAASGGQPRDRFSEYPYNGGQTRTGAAGYPYGGQQSRQDGYPYGGNRNNGGYYRNTYSNAGRGENGSGSPYPYAGGSNGAVPPGGYAYDEESAPKKKGRAGKIIFALLLVLILGVIGYGVSRVISGRQLSSNSPTNPNTEVVENLDELTTAETPERANTQRPVSDALAATEIYQKALPSSVGVLVYSKANRQLSSEGSGVIFNEDNDGQYTYIVTCAHVINESNVSIMVQLADEKEYRAEIMGYDRKTDIGVLRIEESGLTAAQIGDSSKLRVGETVYAIGNPGGTEFANSFTGGMISAIDRPVSSSSSSYTMECIQHTAAINPGNSGGALLNEFGQVIGINSMKIIADEYEGMGFAVPSSVFVDVVNDIIATGYVTNRPKIGITYIPASTEQAYAMFVGMNKLPAGSIIVYSIAADSSLAETDLQKGDLIVSVNGKNLEDSSDLTEVVEQSKIGDTLTLGIVRIHSDYTYEEFEVTATVVEDKGDVFEEEETTTSYFDDYFGDRDPSGGAGNYDDFFNEFFDRYFGGR